MEYFGCTEKLLSSHISLTKFCFPLMLTSYIKLHLCQSWETNIDILPLPKLETLLGIHQLFHSWPFFFFSIPQFNVASSCHVSLVCSGLWQCINLSLFSMTLIPYPPYFTLWHHVVKVEGKNKYKVQLQLLVCYRWSESKKKKFNHIVNIYINIIGMHRSWVTNTWFWT